MKPAQHFQERLKQSLERTAELLNSVLASHLSLVCLLLLSAQISTEGEQEFRVSGLIQAEILAEPPHQSFPHGNCVILFSVSRGSTSWHMRFQLPAQYCGVERVFQFYGSHTGEMYSIVETVSNGLAATMPTAGVIEDGSPLISYSCCAPIFMVWLAYVWDGEPLDSVPRLFYDHRADFSASSPSCTGRILKNPTNADHIIRFDELDGDRRSTNSWAIFRVVETTNTLHREFPSAFELDAYLRTPILIGDKLLLKDGWVDAQQQARVHDEQTAALGAIYRARLTGIEAGGQTFSLPPALDPSVEYQVFDSRFGEGMGLTNSVIYITNRWLSKAEGMELYQKYQVSLRQQVQPFDPGATEHPELRRLILIVLMCLPCGAFVWLAMNSKRKRN